ncbi:MAG TPA: hypothetical protein VER79_12285 [Candidatus Limnocylindrales bacterium]|nr:hypothetical protein [Candidatus Limnocylindrales bacterium]
MENLTLDEVKILSQQNQRPSTSIFLPTHRTSPDNQQDPIRFKNLVQEAKRQFEDAGWKPREIDALLQPAFDLIEESLFWRHTRDGLAVYLAENDFHTYKLPFPVDEQLIIAQSYYMKPVLPQLTNNGHYFILAFSQNEVRLLEGTRDSVGEVELPDDVPTNKQDAVGSAPVGTGSWYFSGNEDPRKMRIEQYLNILDKYLRDTLMEHRSPLVLAGVDYMQTMYRAQSEYRYVLDEGIGGNPEQMSGKELQAAAWPIVEPYFRAAMDEVFGEYQQLVINGNATSDLGEAVAAAFYGRVRKLVVAVDASVWGHFDPETGTVTHFQEWQSEVDDLALLDFAAMQTVMKGGEVYAVRQAEMPTDSPVLAVLRY